MAYRKSTFCRFDSPQCGEVDGLDTNQIWVRDSERPHDEIWMSRESWQQFIDGVKAGEFDLKECHADTKESQLEQV